MNDNFGICPYCGKPAGKNELGYVLTIHPEHRAGTPFWIKWYEKERAAGRRQTAIADALVLAYKRAVPEVNVGLLRMQENNRLRKEGKIV